ERAHRVADQHRRRGEAGERARHLLGIVGERDLVEPPAPLARAVAAQRERVRGMALRGEPVEKMLLPAPRADIGAVHEEERGLWSGGSGLARKDFQPHATGGTAMPLATAGRLPIASYQRFTCGYAARSTRCHSWRAVQ